MNQNQPKLVMGNWKMNLSFQEGGALFDSLMPTLKAHQKEKGEIAFFVPFPYLAYATKLLSGLEGIYVGAQNVSEHEKGAFTGEVSSTMLESLKIPYTLIGHSERRAYFGETDSMTKLKCLEAQKHNITPVLCVGETEEEFESKQSLAIVKKQLTAVFSDESLNREKMVVAYEPIWAIGTGKVASEETIESMHTQINAVLETFGVKLPILYGGSVKGNNAPSIAKTPYVGGVLVGGASLVPQEFEAIIHAFFKQ